MSGAGPATETDAAASDQQGSPAYDPSDAPGVDPDGGDESETELDADADDDISDADVAQGSGEWDDPFIIDHFPYEDSRNTNDSDTRAVDAYACASSTDESGPEYVYRVTPPVAGSLVATLDDVDGDDVDVDVHWLAGPDANACLNRGHLTAATWARADQNIYLVVDTWVNGGGVEQSGPYTVVVEWTPEPSGDCAMKQGEITLVNRDEPLALPAFGPVALEAHLVTAGEFPSGEWPTSFWDGVPEHYALSEEASGFAADRDQPWAPAGEGGSEFGQGSASRPPVLDEAWYVCMYWSPRPAGGTRMLVLNPANGKAVVASAGYETGPGSASRIGGAVEEIHRALGVGSPSRFVMGFLANQDLALGPINCDFDP